MSSDSESPIPVDPLDRDEPAPLRPEFDPELIQADPAHEIILATALEEPNRVHPLSWLFDIISLIRKNLIPAVVALLSASTGGVIGMYIAIFVFVPLLLFSLIRFLTIRYSINQGELMVKEGLLWRRVRTVPVQRIQNIDLVQGIIHRIFKVAEVRIETASGSEPEATLRVLSLERVDELRSAISAQNAKRVAKPARVMIEGESENDESVLDEGHVEDQEVLIQSITTGQLIKAGLASNRGMLLLGVLAGIVYQFELYERVSLDDLWSLVPEDWNVSTIIIVGSILLLIAFLILRVVGVAWHILRFHGYELLRSGDDLKINCGLLTRVSATVPRRRIQFISIHRPLIYRWIGLATIRIETAGGAATSEEDAAATVARRWFVPVLDHREVPRIMAELRPGLDWSDDVFEWQALSSKAALRWIRIGIIQCVLISAIGFGVGFAPFLRLTPFWGAMIGAFLLPFMIYWSIRKSRAMRYGRADFGIAFRSGVFNRKTSVTFFDKIQALSSSQTLFDRRWKMATLNVDTAAAGPAEHLIHVEFLDETFAHEEFLRLSSEAAHHKPAWQ